MIKVGDSYQKDIVVLREDGRKFAALSGDFNPIHTDDEYAKNTRFGQCIVHGIYMGSIISGILGNEFPGNGTIYLEQDLKFLKPVYYEKEIHIRVEVVEEMPRNRFRIKTDCFDEEDLLIDGTAVVLYR